MWLRKRFWLKEARQHWPRLPKHAKSQTVLKPEPQQSSSKAPHFKRGNSGTFPFINGQLVLRFSGEGEFFRGGNLPRWKPFYKNLLFDAELKPQIHRSQSLFLSTASKARTYVGIEFSKLKTDYGQFIRQETGVDEIRPWKFLIGAPCR